MKKAFWFGLIVSGLMLLSQSAYAMVIKGTVAQLHHDIGAVTINRIDPKTKLSEFLNVAVLPDANFEGVESLSDLNIGDEVRVEATQNEVTGQWEATAVVSSKKDDGADLPKPDPVKYPKVDDK